MRGRDDQGVVLYGGATDRYGYWVMWVSWLEKGAGAPGISYGTDALDQVTVSRWRPVGQSDEP